MKTLEGSWKKHVDFRFLSGEDFGDEVLELTVKNVTEEEAFNSKTSKNEKVPVLHFTGTDKGIILNLTNSRAITRLLGTDKFEEWAGKTIPFWGEPHKRHGRVVRVKQNYSNTKINRS